VPRSVPGKVQPSRISLIIITQKYHEMLRAGFPLPFINHSREFADIKIDELLFLSFAAHNLHRQNLRPWQIRA
jgi:hypothetical protein